MSWRDKGDGLSWELTGSFNKYLVRVSDVSGTILGTMDTSENKAEKKKTTWPGVVVILNRVIRGGSNKEVP